MSALRKTGHRPDPTDIVNRRLGLHLHPARAAMTTPLPLSTINRSLLWGVWDQHDASGCEGCAHATGVTLRLACAGTPLPEPVSNVGLYLGALTIDRTPNPDGTLPPLTDSGTFPSSILAAAALWGSCGVSKWGQQPMSSGTLYVDPSNEQSPLIEPPPEKLFTESAYRLQGAFFVQTGGLQRVLDILGALAAGFPVSASIAASGASFQNYSGGVLTGAQMTGDIDHATVIVDYAWTGSAEQFAAWQGGAPGLDQFLVFYGVNSWGTGWGEAGLYRADVTFINQAADACVLSVTRAS